MSKIILFSQERQTEEGGSLTDMDSALGTSSPSLEMDAKRTNRYDVTGAKTLLITSHNIFIRVNNHKYSTRRKKKMLKF
jgi:hypothetical protein